MTTTSRPTLAELRAARPAPRDHWEDATVTTVTGPDPDNVAVEVVIGGTDLDGRRLLGLVVDAFEAVRDGRAEHVFVDYVNTDGDSVAQIIRRDVTSGEVVIRDLD